MVNNLSKGVNMDKNIYFTASHEMCRVSLLHRYRISNAVSHLHLYRGQPQVLEYLIEHGGCSQVELSEALGVSGASIATSIKRLCKAGFVERHEDENDRRINRIFVTEKGKETFLQGDAECKKVDALMFKGFSEDEISGLLSMLQRIEDNLSVGGLSNKDIIKDMIKKAKEDLKDD